MVLRISQNFWLHIGMVWLAMLALPKSAAAAGVRPVMFGYMPMSKGLARLPAQTSLARYSHVVLAFANPDATGAFVAGDAMACMPGPDGTAIAKADLKAAVAAVHKAGAKALLSVGGGVIAPCSGDWALLLGAASRHRMAQQIAALVDEVGADGADVDIEGALLTTIDRAGNYTPFVDLLAAAMKRSGKLLTCATGSYEGGMVPRSALRRFDYVLVMSYDQIGPSWGSPGDEHSSYAKAVDDLAIWRARGVPRARLVLGLPYYGYGYGSYRPVYAYRDAVAAFGADAAAADIVGTRCAGCSYVTQNGPATLVRKATLARDRAAGVMVWELTQDTDDGKLGQMVSDALYSGAAID